MTHPPTPVPRERGARGGANRTGPVPGPLGRALSRLYAAEIARRNRRFDRGEGVVRLDRPVISIGNLSVGGTGKTPMVMHLAGVLLEAGHRPCIAMRGYRAGPGGESDEAASYASELPEVPIIARPDRLAGLLELFHNERGERIDTVLLDDGFQHRRIARDLDLVLMDATRPPFQDRLLPAGWLREPLSSLSRADGVIITHAESVSEPRLADLRARVEASGSRVMAVCRHEWTGLDVAGPGSDETRPVNWLAGRRALAVCAIGNPGPFMAAVERAVGGPAAASLALRDHDPFAERAVARMLDLAAQARADVIVTTAKDWAKLRARRWPLPVARARLSLRFDSGEETLRREVLHQVNADRAEASS